MPVPLFDEVVTMAEWLTKTWLRIKALIKRRQLDRDLQDELSFHLAMCEEKLQARRSKPGSRPLCQPQAIRQSDFGPGSLSRDVEHRLG